MNLTAVMRILNEDDIIEANIRHHRSFIDHFVILDDGSQDKTLYIIKSLISDGFPITLIECDSVVSDERGRNTFLYNYASQKLKANWVFFLDADEFIDMRGRINGMKDFIVSVPGHFESMLLPMRNYKDTVLDNKDEIIVPNRMTWRMREEIGVFKVVVRGQLSGNIHIHEGNHTAYRNNKELDYFGGSNLCIAHYPRRSGWQDIYKWIVMRLKITAAGKREVDKGTGSHYIAPLNTLLRNPKEILENKWFFNQTPNDNDVEDRICYEGGMLKYTENVDYKEKCIKMVLEYAFSLAREFGEEMDINESFRTRILTKINTHMER